jgi:cytochrome b561
MPTPTGYSRAQIGLHWAIAGLVLVQFVFSDGMEDSFDAYLDGEAPAADALRMAWFHAASGIAILLLMLSRLWLRLKRGVPAQPASEPAPARFLASAVHWLFYLLLIGIPVSGFVGWMFGMEAAGDAHSAAATLLLVLIALHLAGALAQFVIFRSNALARITMADD